MALNTRGVLQISPVHIPVLVTILRRMGFVDPFIQEWWVGQRFGLSRALTSLLEWHVRGFTDGSLDSEVEVSRKRLQHLASKPGPYFSPLTRMLGSHRIPFRMGRMIPADATHIYMVELFGRSIPIEVPRSY